MNKYKVGDIIGYKEYNGIVDIVQFSNYYIYWNDIHYKATPIKGLESLPSFRLVSDIFRDEI